MNYSELNQATELNRIDKRVLLDNCRRVVRRSETRHCKNTNNYKRQTTTTAKKNFLLLAYNTTVSLADSVYVVIITTTNAAAVAATTPGKVEASNS